MNRLQLELLQRLQNPDGGWGYRPGSSWTEPTAFALLALLTAEGSSESVRRGTAWLEKIQRPDGGWPPHASVDQSTWVTAAVFLFLSRSDGVNPHTAALGWLLRQTGRESTFITRLRRRMLGERSDIEDGYNGWPWFPGAAAWVTPTALTILALQGVDQPEVKERIADGRRFLLSRMCKDGGWNHGSSRALGYESDSYPETTGVALAALAGDSGLEKSLSRAEEHLRNCRSTQGSSWLILGLAAHGKSSTAVNTTGRSTLDAALSLLASSALQGQNPLRAAALQVSRSMQ